MPAADGLVLQPGIPPAWPQKSSAASPVHRCEGSDALCILGSAASAAEADQAPPGLKVLVMLCAQGAAQG